MNYRDLQAALRPYKEQGKTTIMLTSTKGQLQAELERLEETVSMSQIEDEQVAKTESETPQPTDTQEVEQVAKIVDANLCDGHVTEASFVHSSSSFVHCRSISAHSDGYVTEVAKINYRMDAKEKEEDGWWLEELDSEGLPTENYIAVDDAELERLKANGQIWKHDSKLDRWVPPYIPPNYQSTDDIQLTADDVDAEIETFLGDVAEKKLTEEQLEAIAIALNDANNRSVTASEALAQAGQFTMFTPHQLLSWGFDHIIPRSGMLARFREILPLSKVRVSVKYFSLDNTAVLEAWAESYKGELWSLVPGAGCQEESWYFPSLEYAEQFVEYCQKLNFVHSATVDRIKAEKAMVGVGK